MIDNDQIEKFLSLGALLTETRKTLAELHLRQSAELPQQIAELETKAETGDDDALRKLRLERDRLDLMPRCVSKTQSNVELIEAEILQLAQNFLYEIREMAGEKHSLSWKEDGCTDAKQFGEVSMWPVRIVGYYHFFNEGKNAGKAFIAALALGNTHEI